MASVESFSASVDMDMVKAEYMADMQGRNNKGQHPVQGAHEFSQQFQNIRMKPKGGGAYVIDYGYRACGEIFYVHKLDIQDTPFRFRVIPDVVSPPPAVKAVEIKAPVILQESESEKTYREQVIREEILATAIKLKRGKKSKTQKSSFEEN